MSCNTVNVVRTRGLPGAAESELALGVPLHAPREAPRHKIAATVKVSLICLFLILFMGIA